MASVRETDLDSFADLVHRVVTVINEMGKHTARIVAVIQGLNWLFAGAESFSVLVFRFLFLDMRAVEQHDVAKVVRGDRGMDFAFKAVFI